MILQGEWQDLVFYATWGAAFPMFPSQAWLCNASSGKCLAGIDALDPRDPDCDFDSYSLSDCAEEIRRSVATIQTIPAVQKLMRAAKDTDNEDMMAHDVQAAFNRLASVVDKMDKWVASFDGELPLSELPRSHSDANDGTNERQGPLIMSSEHPPWPQA